MQQHPQTIQPTPELPPFNNAYYSGLAGLLANPAHIAKAEQVYTYGSELNPQIAGNLQSCAESAISTLGDIQATFFKLALANTEARTNRVCEREIADVQFQLGVLFGELQPLLNYLNNVFLNRA